MMAITTNSSTSVKPPRLDLPDIRRSSGEGKGPIKDDLRLTKDAAASRNFGPRETSRINRENSRSVKKCQFSGLQLPGTYFWRQQKSTAPAQSNVFAV